MSFSGERGSQKIAAEIEGPIETAENQASKEVEEDIDPDEIFDRAGREIKEKEAFTELKAIVDQWLEAQAPLIKERLTTFGINETEIKAIIKQLSRDFFDDFRFMTEEIDSLKSGLAEIKDKLKDDPEINDAASWLENASRLAIFKLFSRKLKGEIGEQEGMILSLMDIIKHQGKKGEYNQIYGTISLSLFNTTNLEGYQKIIDHELTHLGLNRSIPDAAFLRLRALKEVSEDHSKLSPRLAFSNVLLAIDESAAHLIEGRKPQFDAYADKMSPKMFEMVYETIIQATKNKSRAEIDQIAVDIYGKTTAKWREDMTMEDVGQMVFDLKNEFKTS